MAKNATGTATKQPRARDFGELTAPGIPSTVFTSYRNNPAEIDALDLTGTPIFDYDGRSLTSGEFIEPDLDGPPLHLTLISVDPDGRQHWVSADRRCETTVSITGETRFYKDDELHRDGAPAFIPAANSADKPQWFMHGNPVAAPTPPGSKWANATFADGIPATVRTGRGWSTADTIADTHEKLTDAISYAQQMGIIRQDAAIDVTSGADEVHIHVHLPGGPHPDSPDYWELMRPVKNFAESYSQTTFPRDTNVADNDPTINVTYSNKELN
ncbi:hypothetical protein [Leifsonia sp. Leaf264]|uniref:hypothetical protein n=1 Tax=Leifsonia sp. Leaf264 TaxID=1736314 RepID=UPI0006FCEB07|nr:hypothetical protein [Leifsonia sp. Leaf264]KQO98149.1 hypothetical protein ASF30_08805 [Leifsonia sp. Leaf264]